MLTAVRSGATDKNLTDEEVVRRVLEGDRELFAVLVRRHSRRLYRVAVSILRDSTEAEDIVQDTFVNAFQHLAGFAGRSKFATWLSRIAVNNALQRVSLRSRQICVGDEVESAVLQLPSHAADPEQKAAAGERARLLERALAALPESYRRVVVCRDLQEFDTETTATLLGISSDNVKVRLHRARRALGRGLIAMGCRPHRRRYPARTSQASPNEGLPVSLRSSVLVAGSRGERNLPQRRQQRA